jgi:hypothetical protein
MWQGRSAMRKVSAYNTKPTRDINNSRNFQKISTAPTIIGCNTIPDYRTTFDRAVRHILVNHAPYPAIALDDQGRLKYANGPASLLLGFGDVAQGANHWIARNLRAIANLDDNPGPGGTGRQIAMSFGELALNFFSTTVSFGDGEVSVKDSLKTEHLFPSDDATDVFLRQDRH